MILILKKWFHLIAIIALLVLVASILLATNHQNELDLQPHSFSLPTERLQLAHSKSVCDGSWDSTNNVWIIETQRRDSIAPIDQCTLESYASKMPDFCIRYVK